MPTPADVRGIAPEFKDALAFSDAKIQTAINNAAKRVNADAWGDSYEMAVTYLAAHLFALSNPQASARPVRVYETPGAQDIGALGSTAYGREYATMRNELVLTPLIV